MNKDKLNFTNIMGSIILIFFFGFGSYFLYGLIDSFTKDDSSVLSNQVWCANCQTYHDRATAEEENQKLVWCVNCNKYHAPGADD
tara:strand:- start:83 stop:337 length:255 start_codon:yes stop_codon:yes gene_type:complete